MSKSPDNAEANPNPLDVRVGKVLNEFLDRQERGDPVSQEELLAEHPDLADELRGYLSLLEDLEPDRQRVAKLMSQGLLRAAEDARYLAQLGPYRITGFIGQGGMGIVLKAYEESLNRTIALKLLRPDLARDGIALERFRREAKTAAALRHPNIVTVHAVGEENGTHYLAMEFIGGPSLAEVIRAHGPLPSEFIREVFHQLISGLAAAHRAGLIHRDIKPSNILLDSLPTFAQANDVPRRREGLQIDSFPPCQGGKEGGSLPVGEGGKKGYPPEWPTSSSEVRNTGCHGQAQRRHALSYGEQHAGAHPINREGLGMPPADPLLGKEGPGEATAPLLAKEGPGEVPNSGRTPLNTPLVRGEAGERDRTWPNGASSPLPAEFIIKITDFGLARMISSQTRLTVPDSALGTPEYMSPEQARGDDNLDHRTDLYSAGVVLYEMLTGRTPFRGDSPSSVIHHILHVTPPDPRLINGNADATLTSLALRLISKEAPKRGPSPGAVLTSLANRKRAASRQRIPRRISAVLLVLGALLGGGWLGIHFIRARPVSAAVCDRRDSEIGSRILVWRRGSGTEEVFRDFRELSEYARCVPEPRPLDLDGDGKAEQVVAGVRPAIEGDCLFAFDLRGKVLWRAPLTPSSDPEWPDYRNAPGYWACHALAVGNIDGVAGEEIVAAARDQREYAACVAVVEPVSGELRLSFLHTGEIHGLCIVEDYFGSSRPAIVAWGVNNKLNGYEKTFEGAAPRLTEYDKVAVLMILDPGNMDGLGPPHLMHPKLTSLKTAMPWAYAFIDLPADEWEEDGIVHEDRSQMAIMEDVTPWQQRNATEQSPFLEIAIHSLASGRSERGSIQVDRNLGFHGADPNPGDPDLGTEVDCLRRWKPIIQQGKYVELD